MLKHAPEWVRTTDPVIRSPALYLWTTESTWTMYTTKKYAQSSTCWRITLMRAASYTQWSDHGTMSQKHFLYISCTFQGTFDEGTPVMCGHFLSDILRFSWWHVLLCDFFSTLPPPPPPHPPGTGTYMLHVRFQWQINLVSKEQGSICVLWTLIILIYLFHSLYQVVQYIDCHTKLLN